MGDGWEKGADRRAALIAPPSSCLSRAMRLRQHKRRHP